MQKYKEHYKETNRFIDKGLLMPGTINSKLIKQFNQKYKLEKSDLCML